MSGSPEPTWEEWLATRPPAIRSLARRFPPGSSLSVAGQVAYIVSYVETAGGDPGVMASFIDPRRDFDGAQSDKFFVCGDHLN